MRLPAMVMLEYPEPMPVAFQTTGGPSLGHSLSRPVSGDRLFCPGPRKRGQSGLLSAAADEPASIRDKARQAGRNEAGRMGWGPQRKAKQVGGEQSQPTA